ncbi:chromosome segregation ATPase [Crocosphaera sp. UHCC 0190]|uniref:chromosome segregation ATPase n=1 Tax=Crocosphaera sp. UHCC 0190 TaxID=3110246 RepID=UPI002B203ADF|nr:chromosome segregation ATPase [Crocosphaera sp. UHCC 0190]MEA5509553.1 chromosome segregation ATPase [Crocosphaera sp. UHCC 0190]
MDHSTNQSAPTSKLDFLQKIYLSAGQISWQMWAIGLILVSGTVGFTATSMLLKLPKSPQCVRIFWPIASASMRIYCAQMEAEQGTVDSYLRAINLVEALPEDHPLRKEINRNVEEWAVAILDMAEEEFQKGKLEAAIKTARRIPDYVQVYQVVEERIEKWRSVWREGEDIFAQVEKELRESNWNLAFREAVKLLSLSNKYWASTKYDETVKQIQLAQEDSSQLDSAYQILRRGGLDNWLKAIADAEKIPQTSYAHQEAQKLIASAKEKIVDYVDELIDDRRWDTLSDVVNRLPDSLPLQEEISDWKIFASAGMDAQTGTTDSLQVAITAVQEIKADRPLHQKAQDLIGRWKLEIEDVAHLQEARNLATGGSIDDLNAAIASAELIPSNNPRYQEARQEIGQWTNTIQLTEDQPILDQARDLARGGDVSELRQAINQAQLIGPNRALSGEAQEDIQRWRASIQRQEDQPILDQANSLGNVGEYDAAIQAAQRINRGRVLYTEAQTKIDQWRKETRAQRDLQEAYLIAQGKTPQALVSAISVVRKIPSSTDVSSQGQQALNRWSYQLLSMAQDMANRSLLLQAIDLAKMIPGDSAAYSSAQAQLEIWKKLLQPPSPPSIHPSPSSEVNPLMETNYAEPRSN